MKSKLLTTLVISTMLASCAVSSTDGVIKPGEQKGGIFGLMKADDVKVDNDDAFKSVSEVVIASFKVGFIDKKTDSAQARGFLGGGGLGGRSSAEMELKGTNDAIKQQVTEAAYKDFVSQLKNKGYKVLPSKEILEDKEFADTKTYDTPYLDDNDSLLVSGSVTKYFQPKELGKIKFFAGESTAATGGFAFDNPAMAATNFAEKTGKKVLHVVYVIDFSNADANNGFGTSSINVGQGLSVAPASKLGLIGGQGGTFSSKNGSLTLGQPVFSTKSYGTIEGTSSDAYKVAETSLNLISAYMGGGTNQKRSFSIKADPVKYKAIATEILKDTNGGIVSKMAGLK